MSNPVKRWWRWLRDDPHRYCQMEHDLAAICDARGIGREDWVPESVLRQIGMTDAELKEFYEWVKSDDRADSAPR